MRRAALSLLVIPVGILVLAVFSASRSSRLEGDLELATVERGPLTAWDIFEGRIESRQTHTVFSGFDGAAVITSLAPEGQRVEAGALLATLDTSAIETTVLELERDLALAKAERDSLQQAKQPLQERALRLELAETRAQLADEDAFLEDSRTLHQDGLVSATEIRQQEARVEKARLRAESLEMELDLTLRVIHAAERQRAAARLASAEQKLAIARRQLGQAAIRSPAAGQVVHLPLHVGGEYRTVRVGDTVYKNQPFLSVPDLSDPLARFDIPEPELSRVATGRRVRVVPIAYPDIQLEGRIESVGSVARTRVGQPHWKRYFEVTIRLDEADPRLRSDMTVHCHVLSRHAEDALKVPRAAVWWQGDTPHLSVMDGPRSLSRAVELGASDATHVEVLAGAGEGDRVRLP